MLWAILAAVRRAPLLAMRLELDGETREFARAFVFVGNNDYVMNGFRIDRAERLDAGS
jgi:diacylglycerol kinase family enzyme